MFYETTAQPKVAEQHNPAPSNPNPFLRISLCDCRTSSMNYNNDMCSATQGANYGCW